MLEIDYFKLQQSIDFAERKLKALTPDDPHMSTKKEALALLLERLRSKIENNEDRFAGYAPVLHVVAERVAKESNPSVLISDIKDGEQPITLLSIVQAILEREQSKLKQLSFKKSDLVGQLYSPVEQLDRLVARIYNLPSPDLPEMDPEDANTYSTALDTWVAEHPFLDEDTGTSSAVFDAVISTHALLTMEASKEALHRELNRGAAANPFLFQFYIDEIRKSDSKFIKGDHIGIFYSSLRAGLSLGDMASLSIEEPACRGPTNRSRDCSRWG